MSMSPDLPVEQVDPQAMLRLATVIAKVVGDQDHRVVFGACALVSFQSFRGKRTVEEDLDLLQEFSEWMAASLATDVS